MKNFNNKLIEWYELNKRILPWKNSFDVYQIWLSEIILQQTRVEQGTPYFIKFLERYPTIVDLANDTIDNVLKLWEGLGYYARARNMHETAIIIRDQYNGIFPKTYAEIRALKGIGDYTAAAIASFAYNLPYAVLDGNVFRVLARIFGIALFIDTPNGKKYFQEKAQQLLDKKNPAIYNQAIMDFGSLICTPKNPKCNICPFSSNCIAHLQNKISDFPVKSKRIIKKERHLHYFIFQDEHHIIIRHRNNQDIWKHLYDFPCVENNSKILSRKEKDSFGLKKISNPIELKQVLTHQIIYAYFYEFNFLIKNESNLFLIVEKERIATFAFPKIIKNYLINRFL